MQVNHRNTVQPQRPKVFMIPYDRNPHFVGRDDLLSQLREELQETKPKKYNHRVAIYGMGGVGKTQIAIEYVYRHENDYGDIYWVNASDEAAFLSGFQGIGSKTGCLSIGTDDSQPREMARNVLGWLRQQENWLFMTEVVAERWMGTTTRYRRREDDEDVDVQN